MIVVGVTGVLGAGKSTVAKMFADLGAVVLDADRLAHDVMEPKQLAWRKILERFGDDLKYNAEDLRINRKKLAERVFGDPDALRDLEAIVHPRVLKRIDERLHRLRRHPKLRMVVLDVPLLFETGSEKLAEKVIVVTASPEIIARRLAKRGMSESEAAQRNAAQMDASAKVALADHVIDNSGEHEATRRQVRALWDQLANIRRRTRPTRRA